MTGNLMVLVEMEKSRKRNKRERDEKPVTKRERVQASCSLSQRGREENQTHLIQIISTHVTQPVPDTTPNEFNTPH